jgi:SAM-dependent methyltransferase
MTNHQPARTGEYWNDPATVAAFTDLPVPSYLSELLTIPAPVGAVALDVGCGAGRNLPALVAAGYHVIAIDVHRAMLEQAHRRHTGLNITFAETTVTTMPIAEQQATLIVCHGVLHNLPNREGVAAGLRELHRVLARNGTLSLNTFTAKYLDPCLTPLGDDEYALPNGQPMTLLTPGDLANVIQDVGLGLRDEPTEYLGPGDPGRRSVWRAVLTRR